MKCLPNEWCFRPWFCLHCQATLGWGESGLMRWILLWAMPLVQDWSVWCLNEFLQCQCSIASYHMVWCCHFLRYQYMLSLSHSLSLALSLSLPSLSLICSFLLSLTHTHIQSTPAQNLLSRRAGMASMYFIFSSWGFLGVLCISVGTFSPLILVHE